MIKRLICLIVILAVCFSFAACTSEGGCVGARSSDDVESQATSEGSSEGDDSTQDRSSSASGTQEGDSPNSDSGSGTTSGTQTGAGSGQTTGFAITKQPIGGAYTAGNTVALSITATTNSGNALSYQWLQTHVRVLLL